MSAFTAKEFALRTRLHWVTTTKAGIAVLWSALLGLVVGLVITSQTLYSATAASRREYAALNALGIPRWRMAWMVVLQSFWIGGAGVLLGCLAALMLARGAETVGVKLMLPYWLVWPACVGTMLAALVAGLFALRSVRLIEPVELLR